MKKLAYVIVGVALILFSMFFGGCGVSAENPISVVTVDVICPKVLTNVQGLAVNRAINAVKSLVVTNFNELTQRDLERFVFEMCSIELGLPVAVEMKKNDAVIKIEFLTEEERVNKSYLVQLPLI